MKQIPNDLFFNWVEGEIAQGRSVQFLLKGVSMYPLIRGGKDKIVLSPCSPGELRPMDVVLFRYRGQHLLHRIIRRDGDLLTIKGDGSYVAMEVCNVFDVIGRVQAVIRPSGMEIPVVSWKWKLPSLIWNKMGILRNPILKILHHMF
jgi:signal peptidase I